jgi:hypothetical protein
MAPNCATSRKPPRPDLPNPWIALSPLLLVGMMNLLFTHWIPQWYGKTHSLACRAWPRR